VNRLPSTLTMLLSRHTRRREFVSLIGCAAVGWPLAAHAQQPVKPPTIGFLGTDASVWSPWTAAFVQRLRELGWIEGRTIAIEYRWSEGRPERGAEIAAEFVRMKVDVIVTNAFAARTVKQVTSVIPIVFALGIDPSRGRPDRKFGAAGRQRHWIDGPAIRSCRQAARTLA
jgi:putative tryptophan/tyrosine transport system substrate-binding protein